MNLKIIVATHKDYRMPQDLCYMPVHVGRSVNPPQPKEHTEGITQLADCTGDDSGENISSKNANYCELTGLYWAWKNLDADCIGLAHYRRHFKGADNGDKWGNILTQRQAEKLLAQYDIILPKQRNYFIESTYDQYVHAHNKQDLDVTFEIISQYYPDYVPAWHKTMKSTKGHRFNMFVMPKEILDRYCSWMFDILFKLEERLDISAYSKNDRRVFGFVSERLLDVWLYTNNVSFTELPVIDIEDVNWLKKGSAFLKRKFIGK